MDILSYKLNSNEPVNNFIKNILNSYNHSSDTFGCIGIADVTNTIDSRNFGLAFTSKKPLDGLPNRVLLILCFSKIHFDSDTKALFKDN